MTTAESAMFRLGPKIADGTIMGARGPWGVFAHDTELNRWFRQSLRRPLQARRRSIRLTRFAISLLGLKLAWEKAQDNERRRAPTTDEVIAAFKASSSTPSTTSAWRSATATRAS